MMYCTYCKAARSESEAPCPHCGAPSPFSGLSLDHSQYAGIGTTGPRTAAPGGSRATSAQLGDQWGQPVPQLSFEESMPAAEAMPPSWQAQGQQGYPPAMQQPAQVYNPASYQQSMGVQSFEWQSAGQAADAQPEVKSQLPVPYQPGMALQPAERQSTISLQLVPDHAIQHLLIPQQSVAQPVYVPPMFTKPRPIVPKYRVVSGLLSIIIMALVLCGGVGYYANTQGVLAKATQFVTGTPPKSLPMVTSTTIPDPPEQTDKDLGPAYNAIPSAVTTLNIDKNNLARQPAKIFKPGQVFYLVFNVQAPADGKGGKVRTKWYTNNKFFTEITSQEQIKGGDVKSGNIQMRFTTPLSGRVELYWNDQLAQKLYFAVK